MKKQVLLLTLIASLFLIANVSAFPQVISEDLVIHTFDSNEEWTVPEDGEMHVTEITADPDSFVVIEKVSGEKKFAVARDLQDHNLDNYDIRDYFDEELNVLGGGKCIQRDSNTIESTSSKSCFLETKYELKKGDKIRAGAVVDQKGNTLSKSKLEIHYTADEPKPECVFNTDCGENGYLGDFYCLFTDVYQNYQEFSCIEGSCQSEIFPSLISNCEYGCDDGTCNPKPKECTQESECGEDSYSDNYCVFNEVRRDYTDVFCEDESCGSETTPEYVDYCAYGCDDGTCNPEPPTCTQESDCGIDGYVGDFYCMGDENVYQDYIDYSCISGDCESVTTSELITECPYGCDEGTCKQEPNDTTAPIIDIVEPDDNKVDNDDVYLEIQSNEELSDAWFTVDGGSSKIMVIINGTNFYGWLHNLEDGEQYEITFYGRDLAGNVGSSTFTLKIDLEEDDDDNGGKNLGTIYISEPAPESRSIGFIEEEDETVLDLGSIKLSSSENKLGWLFWIILILVIILIILALIGIAKYF